MATKKSADVFTLVFVQRDGIVNHRHVGLANDEGSAWHDPSTKHVKAPNAHVLAKAATPRNAEVLKGAPTATHKAIKGMALARQYAEAIGGKSYNFVWVESVKARKAAAGSNWAYGKAAIAPEPVKAKRVRMPRKAAKVNAIADSIEAATPIS